MQPLTESMSRTTERIGAEISRMPGPGVAARDFENRRSNAAS